MSSILKSFQNLINDLDELIILLHKSDLDHELKFVLTERLEKAISLLRDDEKMLPLNENLGDVIDKTLEDIDKILSTCQNERVKEHLIIIFDELINDKKRLNLIYEEELDKVYELIKELDKVKILVEHNPKLNTDTKLSVVILVEEIVRRLREYVENNYNKYIVYSLEEELDRLKGLVEQIPNDKIKEEYKKLNLLIYKPKS